MIDRTVAKNAIKTTPKKCPAFPNDQETIPNSFGGPNVHEYKSGTDSVNNFRNEAHSQSLFLIAVCVDSQGQDCCLS